MLAWCRPGAGPGAGPVQAWCMAGVQWMRAPDVLETAWSVFSLPVVWQQTLSHDHGTWALRNLTSIRNTWNLFNQMRQRRSFLLLCFGKHDRKSQRGASVPQRPDLRCSRKQTNKNVSKKVLGARGCEACQSWLPVRFLKITARESCCPRLRMRLCIEDSDSRGHVSAPNAAFIPVPSLKAWPWGPVPCRCHVRGGQGAQCSGRSLSASEVGHGKTGCPAPPQELGLPPNGGVALITAPSSSGLCPMHTD